MIRLREKRTGSTIILLAGMILAVLMISTSALAQATRSEVKKTIVQSYVIGGNLTAIDLRGKTAVIDGNKWELSEDFDTKGLPDWLRQGRYTCNNCHIVVWYYVRLRIQAGESLDLGEKNKEGTTWISTAEDLQALLQRGAKIYKIEVMPA